MTDKDLRLRAFIDVMHGKCETADRAHGNTVRAAFIKRYKELRSAEIEKLRAKIIAARG